MLNSQQLLNAPLFQWIPLDLTRPNINSIAVLAEQFRQSLHRRAFGLIVPGKDESQSQIAGFQRRMKPPFAGQEYVAALPVSIAKVFRRRAAGDPHAPDRAGRIADGLQLRCSQPLPNERDKVTQRNGNRQLADATGPRSIERRSQRYHIDRGLFIGMGPADRLQGSGDAICRAENFQPHFRASSNRPGTPTAGFVEAFPMNVPVPAAKKLQHE